MKNKSDTKNYIELKQKLLINEINSFCNQILDILYITPDNKPNISNIKYDDIIEIKSTDFDINKKNDILNEANSNTSFCKLTNKKD